MQRRRILQTFPSENPGGSGPYGREIKSDHLTAVSGVSGHMLDKPNSACECVRWFLSGFSRFHTTY